MLVAWQCFRLNTVDKTLKRTKDASLKFSVCSRQETLPYTTQDISGKREEVPSFLFFSIQLQYSTVFKGKKKNVGNSYLESPQTLSSNSMEKKSQKFYLVGLP